LHHLVKVAAEVQLIQLTAESAQQFLAGDHQVGIGVFQLHEVGGLAASLLGDDERFQSAIDGCHSGGDACWPTTDHNHVIHGYTSSLIYTHSAGTGGMISFSIMNSTIS
jgi:hypothetical protein